ncbi:MAG: aldehyde ferredoxin oxidoreductase family protein [Thermacetogeniaceae bacterium]
MQIGGVWGKILHVDLQTGSFSVEEPKEDFYLNLCGGRAVIAHYLLKYVPVGADPLGPDNLLIIAPGIFNGTYFPGAGRVAIGAKSPRNGYVGSSEAGGFFGHELKKCGFDAVVIHGKSSNPVYLLLDGEKAELRDASHIWGKTIYETNKVIRNELANKSVKIAAIGPAGENLVPYAAIMVDVNRAAGRTGLGAVMGSKNLKAIAVKGNKNVRVADRKRFEAIRRWIFENYKDWMSWAVHMGTVGALMNNNSYGVLPTRNFREGVFERAEEISGDKLHRDFVIKRDTCIGCPCRCKMVVKYEGRKFNVRPEYGGPEYETLASFGSNVGNSDLATICKANELCNAYGLDTISTGGVIAFVMECFDRGLLTSDKTGGFVINFGDSEAIIKAIEMITYRNGFGSEMANGVAYLSKQIAGSEEFAMHVKNQEIPYHEPRGKWMMGMGYTLTPGGADHQHNVHDTDYTDEWMMTDRVKPFGVKVPQERFVLDEEKVKLYYYEGNFINFLDCAVLCQFYTYFLNYEQVAEAISSITGINYRPDDILTIGERAITLSRLFNVRQGLELSQETLPKRFFEGLPTGPFGGRFLPKDDLEKARQYYFKLMGWDDQGRPKEETLKQLKLESYI